MRNIYSLRDGNALFPPVGMGGKHQYSWRFRENTRCFKYENIRDMISEEAFNLIDIKKGGCRIGNPFLVW
jgi:hypothetical protein